MGCPIGSPEYVAARLNAKSEEQRSLFQRIPLVADLQAAWVLLFYCGATSTNSWLRNVQPAQTFWYAQQHDDNVWDCFSRLTGFSHGQFAHGASETPRSRKRHAEQPVVSQPFEGVCSLWSTWVSSHRSGSPCSSMPDLSWKGGGPNAAEDWLAEERGYHKLSNIICRLSSGRPCLNLSGPSGVLIRVHWLLRSSWLCPPPGPPDPRALVSKASASIALHFPQLPMWPYP